MRAHEISPHPGPPRFLHAEAVKQGSLPMKWLSSALLATFLFCAPARAQSVSSNIDVDTGPVPGGHEMQAWFSATHVLYGMSSSYSGEFLQIGGRYGWVLTKPRGPGLLRGEFEYAVNFLPVIIPFQSNGATYGFGLDPITTKWNFQRRGNLVPYVEVDGGGMETIGRVPVRGTHWNFTASGALGMQILRGGHVWSVDFRFYHISDAHIDPTGDPTYNALQVRVGFGIFRGPKKRKL